ncbi:MAG TPA: S1C family serine protease [Sphingomicrobium sp.]|nr:S1C family serine protease [Sphingomicrobium sp.]
MNSRSRNLLLVVAAVLVAAIGGGYVGRNFTPTGQPKQQHADQGRRPIIQIVRQQPGLPSLADMIATLCPSVAAIAPAGATGSATGGVAISPDGWVLAATAALPTGNAEARFGAGDPMAISETRSDPVSGLAILKTAATGLTPVRLADQAFPRVGDFGFAIGNPAGAGCSAQPAMVASDFLTDGGASSAYIRLQPMGPDLPPGSPFMSGEGQVIGVVSSVAPANSVIPGDIVADIADELLRGSLSPSTRFGFRAEDFDQTLSARLSDSRSTGTAVALVQPKTPAARAGLQAGDIVVAVNGSPVASASELGRALDGAGKTASIDVARADQRLTLTIARVPGQ